MRLRLLTDLRPVRVRRRTLVRLRREGHARRRISIAVKWPLVLGREFIRDVARDHDWVAARR